MPVCILQFDKEMRDRHGAFLRRKVADILRLSSDPKAKLGKKKEVASYVHRQLNGYDFKEVYEEVGRRQDHQKYERQQLRVREFIRMNPRVTSQEGIAQRFDPVLHAERVGRN